MLSSLSFLEAIFWSMLQPHVFLLGAVTFLFFAAFFRRRSQKNYPPGPPGQPIFGNFFHLDFKQSHLAVQQFVEKYGNIIQLEFGSLTSVLVTGLPLIKEVLMYKDNNFLGRPVTPLREHGFKTNGLIMSTGQIWKEQRRFTLTTLRNFGLGKKSLEERIQEEAQHLVQAIMEENGQPFDPHFKINNAVSNIICSVTFGERFEYQDDKFQKLLWLLDEVTYLEASVTCQLFNIFPRVMNFLPGPHKKLFKYWEELKLFVAQVVEKHKSDWSPAETRDFIDAYLNEIEKHKSDTSSSFNEENLICSTLDLFFAGTETTSTTLRWGLLYMALNPEVQEKVQAEIDRVIGQSPPNMAVRESMPYTNAVIHEVQRMGNILPLNVPRAVVSDTTLAGYDLRKGTVILTNLTALHRDPAEWTTPNSFNPEHFLENGQFKKRECFLPFSIGKRVCLGEQLARTELFIFFTAFLQNFTFRPPDNEKLTEKFRMGLTISPVKYHIRAIPRA